MSDIGIARVTNSIAFQVLISDDRDEAMGFGNNVCFCYEEIERSRGSGPLGTTVGVNKSSDEEFFQIGRFDRFGTDYNGPFGNSGVDHLDSKSFCFNASPSGEPNPSSELSSVTSSSPSGQPSTSPSSSPSTSPSG
jgi:hypothetical protein